VELDGKVISPISLLSIVPCPDAHCSTLVERSGCDSLPWHPVPPGHRHAEGAPRGDVTHVAQVVPRLIRRDDLHVT